MPAVEHRVGSVPTRFLWGSGSTSEDLLPLPAHRECVHELVEIPRLPGERGLDHLDPVSADHVGDQVGVWIECRPTKEVLVRDLFLDQRLNRGVVQTGQLFD